MSDTPSTLRLNPGALWRFARRVSQVLVWLAILSTPFIGGWQRVDANDLSSWQTPSWGLAEPLAESLESRADLGEAIWSDDYLLGGGTGVEYLGVPMVDPVAGAPALTGADLHLWALVGILLPFLVGLLLGRVFCGWFCPYGSLARALERLVRRLPIVPPRWKLGDRRPLRFVILAVCLVGGALGAQQALVLALPHLAIQQSVYALWLMGGGGAILGWLLGLLVAGVLFGPTTYCATLCPTGGLLALLGRFRPFRLRIEAPQDCGRACNMCDVACWLQLNPSSGDPGPDCDSCARCAQLCPHDNLRVGAGRGRLKRSLPVVTTLSLAFAVLAGAPANAGPQVRPGLLLDAQQTVEEVSVAVGVFDLSRVVLDPDDPTPVGGVEVSIRLARGERAPTDELGRLGNREAYDGALAYRLERGAEVLHRGTVAKPNGPRSTGRRTLFVERSDNALAPGDRVVVEAVAGWLAAETAFVIPEPRTGARHGELFLWFFTSLFVMGGALALSIGMSGERRAAR
jgi:ferredoxin-type protein NapH